MGMFVLFILHHLLNRKWTASIMKGRASLFRIIQIILVIVMALLMGGSMVSGVLLSNHIFRFVRISGISTAVRQLHMFCAYWGFVIMSFHLGIHWNLPVNMMGKLFKRPSVGRKQFVRSVAFLTACYGIYALEKRQIGSYLLMKLHFVFYDYTENVLFFLLDYLAVMSLFMFIGYYSGRILKYMERRRQK